MNMNLPTRGLEENLEYWIEQLDTALTPEEYHTIENKVLDAQAALDSEEEYYYGI